MKRIDNSNTQCRMSRTTAAHLLCAIVFAVLAVGEFLAGFKHADAFAMCMLCVWCAKACWYDDSLAESVDAWFNRKYMAS